jgi:trehalose-6-phosphate synthase
MQIRVAIPEKNAKARAGGLEVADLIGFQTGDDAFNFSRYLTRECGLHSRDFNFIVGDRTVRIDVFPVGIETDDELSQ